MGRAEPRKRPINQATGRMLGSGVDPADFTKMVARTDAGEDWVEVCEELGDTAYALAEEAVSNGHTVTARRFYLNAAGGLPGRSVRHHPVHRREAGPLPQAAGQLRQGRQALRPTAGTGGHPLQALPHGRVAVAARRTRPRIAR